MTAITAFAPNVNGTVSATAQTAAGNLTLPTRASNGMAHVRIYNAGPNIAFIEVSSGTATVTTSMPIIPEKQPEIFACPPGITAISMITATGTAVIYATLGLGN